MDIFCIWFDDFNLSIGYDILTRMNIVDNSSKVLNKMQDTIISVIFVVFNIVLINGLQDKIFA